jgi:hypothetical protein
MLALLLIAALALLNAAWGALPAEIEIVERDPAWSQVRVTGTVDRPESLASAEILVAASADKATPFHDRFIAATYLDQDDSFALDVPVPPGGLYLWVVTKSTAGAWEQGFHQLYNHYPLHPSEDIHDLRFTMSDYRLTFEGVDPWAQIVAPWWWTFPAAGLALVGLLVFRLRTRRTRARRLERTSEAAPLSGERWWLLGILAVALALRLPGLGESYSMTEFIHAQIASRSTLGGEHHTEERRLATPSCREVCSEVLGARYASCELACVQHFGEEDLPKAVAACAYRDTPPEPAALLGCMAVEGRP